MDSLFERFILEKRYLSNLSENTLEFYRNSYKAYQRVLSKKEGPQVTADSPIDSKEELPTKDTLKDFIIGLQKAGTSVATINCYCRGMNSFLTWLYKEDYVSEPLRLALLKQEKKVLKPLTDSQLRQILSFKPATFTERRLLTLLSTLLD